MILGFLSGLIYWCIPLAKPNITPVNVSAENLRAHVEHLATTIGRRDEDAPENLQRTVDYIQKHFKDALGEVSFQTFHVPKLRRDGSGQDFTNVIASWGDTRKSPLIIGGHYDTCGDQPGADDNASAIAGLLEIARLLKAQPPALLKEHHVMLVAYACEEPPFFATKHMGSAHHAKHLKRRGIVPQGVLILEMIGYFTDKPNSQKYPFSEMKWIYPTVGNFIAVVGRTDQVTFTAHVKNAMKEASPLPVSSINAPPSVPDLSFSDHRNYWEYHWDAVMITDTSFYRNPHYHQPTDTPDTLDYRRMAQVVAGTYAALEHLMAVK